MKTFSYLPSKLLVILASSVLTLNGQAEKLDPSLFAIYDCSGAAITNLVASLIPAPPTSFRIVGNALNEAGTNSLTSIGNTISNGSISTTSLALSNLTDNNLRTFTILTNPPVLLIDLHKSCVIDRLVVNGSSNQFYIWNNQSQNTTNPPLGLIVAYVGNTPNTTTQAAEFTIPYDAGNPVNTEVDLRFSPLAGRYIRLELQTKVAWGFSHWPGYQVSTPPPVTNLAWNIGELEIHGFTSTDAQTKLNAVVLPTSSPAPLALAAAELSYYLGELSGKPYPIIAPTETNLYPGAIYRLLDLKSLAPSYSIMMSNIASGLLPTNVNVQIQGREIVFNAWPYRTVLWSVWEFLEKQGVRWVYPDAHGDSVPTGKGIDLSILPLKFTPSARSIYANWDTTSFQPWVAYQKQSLRQGYLYPWRNRWNNSWGGSYGPLGGAEIPSMPVSGIALNSDYSEGFVGYPHNFNDVIPTRILLQHSNWWGYSTNLRARVSPAISSAPAFSMDDPELINWVAHKMLAIEASTPLTSLHPMGLAHSQWAYNLLPLDATTYCECADWCAPANLPTQTSGPAWVKLYDKSFSGSYYQFVSAVANAVVKQNSNIMVGALAYADVFEPPLQIATLPSNVQVEVCLYGAPNLPMSSPANASIKSAFDSWASKCSHLATYDYALLHTDYWQTNPSLPVPLVSATVDRAIYLNQIGALNGGCQATTESIPYNPWNFYAYPRIRWNVNQTASSLISEFFNGYFQEVATPMQAYYQNLENYQISNNVNMHYGGYCYGITPGSFPIQILAQMQTFLRQAETQVTNWFVAERVARLRQGFNWVITNSGLANIDLNNASNYPTMNIGNSPLTIDLKTLKASGTGLQLLSNGEWVFWAPDTLQKRFYLPTGGTFKVTVVARGKQSSNIWPNMNAYFGPSSASFSVSSITNSQYTFSATIPNGVWDLVISFNNGASGGARNLYINQINITRQ